MNYAALCAYAADALDEPLPAPIHIGRGEAVPPVPVGIYIALGLDGSVLYVGSVIRPRDEKGIGSRIVEHLRKRERFELWDQLYVVPLLPGTSPEEVRRIEGRIGAHLSPSMSKALPKLLGQKRRRI